MTTVVRIANVRKSVAQARCLKYDWFTAIETSKHIVFPDESFIVWGCSYGIPDKLNAGCESSFFLEFTECCLADSLVWFDLAARKLKSKTSTPFCFNDEHSVIIRSFEDNSGNSPDYKYGWHDKLLVAPLPHYHRQNIFVCALVL
jgi:hypothetical protein